MKNIPVVPGQIYEDNDFRSVTRFVTVLSVNDPYAICRRGERNVRIQVKRLQNTSSRGYSLFDGGTKK